MRNILEQKAIDHAAASDLLDVILAHLSGRQLFYILLRLQGYSAADIARCAETSPDQVYWILSKAHAKLRRARSGINLQFSVGEFTSGQALENREPRTENQKLKTLN